MKWLGAMMLVVAGAAAGVGKTVSIRRQIVLLEDLMALIRHIGTELRQRGAPLPEILEQHRSSRFPLIQWADALREGQTVLQAVEPWLSGQETDTGRTLSGLCAVLGRYDGETQARACDHAVGLLAGQADHLRRQLAEKGRLYHTVPLTIGLMAALVLF